MKRAHLDLTPEDLFAHSGWLRRLALALLRDPDGVDDAVQETFLKALRSSRRRIENVRNVRSWLFTIMVRIIRRSVAERRPASYEQADEVVARMPSPLEVAETLEMQGIILGMLQGLEPSQRNTLVMYYIHECTASQIAQAEEVAVETIYTRLKRGRAAIRKELDRKFGGREHWQAPLIAIVHNNQRPLRDGRVLAPRAAPQPRARWSLPRPKPSLLSVAAGALVVAGAGFLARETLKGSGYAGSGLATRSPFVGASAAAPPALGEARPAAVDRQVAASPMNTATSQPIALAENHAGWDPWQIREKTLAQLTEFAGAEPDVVDLLELVKLIANHAPPPTAAPYEQDDLSWRDLPLGEQGLVISFGRKEHDLGVRIRLSPSVGLPPPYDPRLCTLEVRVRAGDRSPPQVRGTVAYSIIPGSTGLPRKFIGRDVTLGHSFVLSDPGRLQVMRHRAHIRENQGQIVVDNIYATTANAREVRTDASVDGTLELFRALEGSACWK